MDRGIQPVGHVFISYRHEDSAGADRLHVLLEEAGIRVWRDKADLWPGDDWRIAIRRTITEGTLVFLACFSAVSIVRRQSWQNEELNLAVEQMRLRAPDEPWLIPVRFDNCEIPEVDLGAGRTLRSIHRCDLFGEEADSQAARLVTAIQRILGRVPASQETPGQPRASRSRHATRIRWAWAAATGLAIASSIVTFIALPTRQPAEPGTRSIASVRHAALLLNNPLRDPGTYSAYAGIAFSPDGKTLATADGTGTIYLWDVATSVRTASLSASAPHGKSASHGFNDVAFSPDGSTLAAADGDGTVYVWSMPAGKLQTSFPIGSGAVTAVAFSPAHNILAAAAGPVTYLWNVATRELATRPLSNPGIYAISALAFSPRGSVLAVSNFAGQVYLWNLATSNPSPHLLDRTGSDSVYGIAFSRGGTILATTDGNGRLDLWNVARRTLAARLPGSTPQSALYGVAFGKNGTIVAAANGDGRVYLWNVATGQLLATLNDHTTGAQTIALSREDVLAVHNDGRTYLWNAGHLGERHQIQNR